VKEFKKIGQYLLQLRPKLRNLFSTRPLWRCSLTVAGLEPCEPVVAGTEVKGQAPSVVPRDLTSFSFDSDEDIQSTMLTKADIATVVSSYEKTIGLFATFLLLSGPANRGHPGVQNPYHLDPLDLPKGIHVNRKNTVRIILTGVGGIGCRTLFCTVIRVYCNL